MVLFLGERSGAYHGEKLKLELLRLKNLGAPVSEVDFAESLLPKAADVREEIDEVILKGLTLEEAQEIIAGKHYWSRAALLRRFPRASKGSGSVDLLKKRQELFPYDPFHARQIAFSLRNQGSSYRQIAVELTKVGYKTSGELKKATRVHVGWL